MAESGLVQKMVAEFVGTFLLIFTIGCNVLSKNTLWAGVSIACVLMVSIFSFGAISGACFNPAVAVAVLINGNKDKNEVGAFCVVEIAAGILAGFAYVALFKDSFALEPKNIWAAGAAELLYTFMLCFVVLNVACVKKGCQSYFGLAIGFVIIAGAYGAGAVSGGCFNPAVAFGIDMSSSWTLTSPKYVPKTAFIYTAFEIAGAALAAVVFKVVRPNGGEKDEEYSPTSKLLGEFIGTFILVLTVGLNVLGGGNAFSIAASLMCMIYALGDVSGANFNPAVTVALLVSKKGLDEPQGSTASKYITAQILGGIAAAFTYSGIHGMKTFELGPGAGHTTVQALVAEFVFTFVLCLIVLCVAVEKKTHSDNFFALAIGSCVTVGGFAIGKISGGSLNPAVSFGIATSDLVNHGSKSLIYALFYTAIECAGAAAAAGVVMVTHPDPVAAEKKDAAEKA